MKRLSLLLILCFITSFLFADAGIGLSNTYKKDKKKAWKFDKSRLFVGGGLNGGSLFNGGYFVAGSPTVGYRFTDRLHAGISFGVTYFRTSFPYNNYNTAASEKYIESGFHYSPSLFVRYFPIDVVFLQASPEYNSFRYFDDPGVDYNTGLLVPNPQRLNIMSFLVGGGYAQRLGENTYMMISVMYDLVQNPNSPYYRQPIFGGGLALGLFGR